MALTPAQNDALIREINEAVRQDDLLTFWKRFGLWVAGAVILGLAVFGGWLLWQDQQRKAADAAGERYSALLASAQTGKLDESIYGELEKADQPGYRGAAQLIRAATLAKSGNGSAAALAYSQVAADQDLPQPFRDLALIRQTAVEFDKLPPQGVIDRLRPLAQAGNPWFGSAGEMTALAYLKLGKLQQAGAMFASLATTPDVPRTIQTRAVEMASGLGVDARIAPAQNANKENSVDAQ